ncbi:MAG: indole-3-glycerol phosphate synthase TrpC [Bacteroidaceae bacterium]
MKDILEDIVAHKRVEVRRQKELLPPRRLYSMVEDLISSNSAMPSMSQSLMKDPCGIIAEFKRKSPSKGWIKEDGLPEVIPVAYAENGAAALSILTDRQYFGGDLKYIKQARPLVKKPILRKDFIIDEYQIFEARMAGADAVLLIAADLNVQEARTLTDIAHELGLEVLMELHSEQELDYAELDVDMVGVNNRDLGSFHTDVANSFRMSNKLPQNKVLVSESGLDDPTIVSMLRQAGYHGFLMGEHFMRTEDPGAELARFIKGVDTN